MKIRQHIPSFFTFINLFLGFLAIINIMDNDYIIACYFILAASVFDSIDGKLARLMDIPTNFGKEIDSLADMVSFCLAPSILVYSLYTYDMPGILGEIIASSSLIMGAIRLARFNLEEEFQSANFLGLPTPMNALAIASLVLFVEEIKVINIDYTQPKLLLPLILSLSYLMISNINFPKFPLLDFKQGNQNTLRLIGVLIFIISFFISIFVGYSYWILAIFVSFYILSALINHSINLGNIRLSNQDK